MTKEINIWEAHGRVYDRPIGNPYIDPPAAPKKGKKIKSKIKSLDDFLVLENIVCVDADGKEFEKYDHIYVRKDIFRDAQGKSVNFNPYQAVVHCEENNLFLPSFALTCNVVASLFKNKTDSAAKLVLDQYQNHSGDFGYHAQNTIIDWGKNTMIHYPTAADFNQTGAVNNGHPRKALSFAKNTLGDCLLENALKDSNHTRYVKQLTGLADPAVLVELGNYFGKPARLWFPWSGKNGAPFTEKRTAWFGCNGNGLDLDGSNNLDNDYAVRGVQRANASNQG